MSQCEVGREDPPGCGIGPDAVAYFNSGLDLSDIFFYPEIHPAPRPRWVQITAHRDENGRVGRIYYRPDDSMFVYVEKPFVPKR